VARLCRALGVSRSGFYAWASREQPEHDVEDARLRHLVYEAHVKGRRKYGSIRVYRALKKKGERVSRKRVVRLMQEQGLVGRARRRFKHSTDSDHSLPTPPNLLDRDFTASAPDLRWAGDTTELLTPGGKLYLAVIIDLFSRYVVGWALGPANDTELTLRALKMALGRRCPKAGLLHHSDQGSNYASELYRQALAEHGIVCSMSRSGNCLDNAAVESWNSTLKNELGECFESARDAQTKLFDFIEAFYNRERIHSTIDYCSPAEFEEAHRLSTAFKSPPGPPSIHSHRHRRSRTR
jgi:putative transposase